jgi:hypothetical protein
MYDEDDIEEANRYADQEAAKYLSEYPEGAVVRRCPLCGRVMRYRSMAYDEGIHFDTCI